jgi:hypothetical protein
MEQKKDLSLVNCIATSLLAYFITVPGHELLHLLTHMIYGDKLLYYSACAVDAVVTDYSSMPLFHRIMDAGASACILNAIFGIILVIVLLKKKMGPMLRVFLIQLMGAQISQGFGYFMIGGFFGVGDWGNVFNVLTDQPGLVTVFRITLSIIGSAGIVALFFILNHMSYYFIKDSENKKERMHVAARLHLPMFIIGVVVGTVVWAMSPVVKSGELSFGIGLFFDLMWVPFFWGFMFTGVMKTLPPKESRFLYPLPAEPHHFLLAAGIVLILVDIFVFGPGIFFS